MLNHYYIFIEYYSDTYRYQPVAFLTV